IIDAYKFNDIAKFSSHQLYDIRFQTLVDRHHHTQAHTLADYLRVAYVHQVSQLAHTDELSNLQPVVRDLVSAGMFSHFVAFGAAILSFQAFPTTTGAG